MARSLPKSEQRKKFEQAAREHGADTSEAVFDQVLRKVANTKPRQKAKAAKAKRR